MTKALEEKIKEAQREQEKVRPKIPSQSKGLLGSDFEDYVRQTEIHDWYERETQNEIPLYGSED
ncbi:hypothetical protein EXS74_01380 [Candidatus Woesearchaeota archaeon]|nr:hypothetical protein [Candidatus Woesearchaeota archaeon]